MSVVDGKVRHNKTRVAINPGQPASSPRLVVKDGLRRLGLPHLNEGLHTLRRSAARQIFDALVETRRYDGALRVVQSLLHHRSVQTTEQYIGLSTEALTRDDFLRTAVLLREPDPVLDGRLALPTVKDAPPPFPRPPAGRLAIRAH
jgi:integrase